MARTFILIMDSFGIGSAEDADSFGDTGADTLGHIAKACEQGKADEQGRSGALEIPNLLSLGLGKAWSEGTGKSLNSLTTETAIKGAYGFAQEVSKGKDTPSGHWEIAGLPVDFDWGFFPTTIPSFPKSLTDRLIEKAELKGILGDKHASGTVIIEELGEEHVKTGMPICYTSADSVFQIAAHEEHFGLDKLYELCKIAKELCDEYNVGRVIARPFIGEDAKSFKRTGNRRDYTTEPHEDTLLDKLVKADKTVVSVGKISDIFAHRGISEKVKATGNMALFDETLRLADEKGDGSLIFTNFVDFDAEYGHRRNVAGYAKALEDFDKRLPELFEKLEDDDLVLISADHGCDPTWEGTDHTREYVPVIFYKKDMEENNLGRRATFADMGQTIAKHFGIDPLTHGTACF
ncbi:phosphopentomutase [Curvivirga sp.]|uniref:phosphopentomutase n=1 Tax=Curvivirga sp. TaxID=2856848 RepID=UPI003B5B1484